MQPKEKEGFAWIQRSCKISLRPRYLTGTGVFMVYQRRWYEHNRHSLTTEIPHSYLYTLTGTANDLNILKPTIPPHRRHGTIPFIRYIALVWIDMDECMHLSRGHQQWQQQKATKTSFPHAHRQRLPSILLVRRNKNSSSSHFAEKQRLDWTGLDCYVSDVN
jgi:hypothetical protein